MFTDGYLKQYKDWNCKMYALLDAEQGSTSKVDPVPVVWSGSIPLFSFSSQIKN